MKIKNLLKKDYKRAAYFAIKGMHLNRYVLNPLLLNLYGRYFLYLELNRATRVLAAYDEDDQLAGLLLAEIYGEIPRWCSLGKRIYVKVFDVLQHMVAGSGVGIYDYVNQKMYREYRKNHRPDGEIIFLAANPNSNRKGVGSLLLAELEKKTSGIELFLYTDSSCTWQFYEHRGFERFSKAAVEMEIEKRKVPLECYLYYKIIS